MTGQGYRSTDDCTVTKFMNNGGLDGVAQFQLSDSIDFGILDVDSLQGGTGGITIYGYLVAGAGFCSRLVGLFPGLASL